MVGDGSADQLAQAHPGKERRQGQLHLGGAGRQRIGHARNAGTYMSVASGAIAVSNTTVATSPVVSPA